MFFEVCEKEPIVSGAIGGSGGGDERAVLIPENKTRAYRLTSLSHTLSGLPPLCLRGHLRSALPHRRSSQAPKLEKGTEPHIYSTLFLRASVSTVKLTLFVGGVAIAGAAHGCLVFLCLVRGQRAKFGELQEHNTTRSDFRPLEGTRGRRDPEFAGVYSTCSHLSPPARAACGCVSVCSFQRFRPAGPRHCSRRGREGVTCGGRKGVSVRIRWLSISPLKCSADYEAHLAHPIFLLRRGPSCVLRTRTARALGLRHPP